MPVPTADFRVRTSDLGAFGPKTTSAPSSTPATAAAFFRSLPWTGAAGLGEVISSIRVTAVRNDSALDPRLVPLPAGNPLLTGMLSAARTSDRLATSNPPPAKARTFFASLPW
jgi:hypothetical protein